MNISRIALSVVLGASLGTLALAQDHGSGSSHSGSSGGGSHYGGASSNSHYSGGSSHFGGGSSGSSHYQGYSGSHYGSSGHSYESPSRSSSNSFFGRSSSSQGFGSYHGYSRSYSSPSRSYSQGPYGNSSERGYSSSSEHGYSNLYGHGYSNFSENRTGSYGTSRSSNQGMFGSGSAGANRSGSGSTGQSGLGSILNRVTGSGSGFGSSIVRNALTGNHNLANGFMGSGEHGQALVRGFGGNGFGGRSVGNRGWRDGYFHPSWGDGSFFFGFYAFDPWAFPVVVSPWYYYPMLPAYLPYNRVAVVPDYADWGDGAYYGYMPAADPNSYGNPDLNSSIAELQGLFGNADEGALDQLLDPSVQVGIYNDGQYMYSVQGQDFRQMMLDNVHGVQNVNFAITNVKLQDGYAIVQARHEFNDPQDGGDSVVYQEYRLKFEGDHYVIEDFNMSKNPDGARTFF